MNSVFSENLKKFRLAKGFTQEQVADKLNVNAQTVSRWECGTTLPDVLMLPELSGLYEVTVDDFYKKSNSAYGNLAGRLAAVYEKSRDPADFMSCREEYLKLMKTGELSIEDKWQYGWIHMYMMNYCRDVALEWYKKAVEDDPLKDPQNHQIASVQRIWMYFLLKREDEIVTRMKVKYLLESLPNVGKITAASIMEEIGINESRRVQGLGKRQKAMILEKLA